MSSSSSSTTTTTTKQLRALVLGATGATGSPLVAELSTNPRVGKITTLVRRQPAQTTPNVNAVVVDFDKLAESAGKDVFRDHDVVFCCLGTTRKDAGSAEAFIKVDHDYVLAAAQLAKDAQVPHFSIVTAQGSNANSWFLYMKTKGLVENALKALSFTHLSIFQPGLLARPDSTRFGEKLAAFFVPALPTNALAKAMLVDALKELDAAEHAPTVQTISNSEIKQLAK